MAIEQQISVKGAVTYWNLSESDPKILKEAWKAAGLEKFAPRARTEQDALKKALKSVFLSDHRRLIRPLADDPGFAIISETGGDERRTLTHEQELAVTVAPGGKLIFEPKSHTDATRIDEEYRAALGSVPALKVSRALVGLLESALHATPLRGGIYWVPDDAINTWKTIADGVEAAGNASCVYLMRTAMDDTAKKAVLDALTADIEKEVASILADTTADSNLGVRGLASRKTKAEDLVARVEEYEKILDVKLQTLRTKAKEADAAATLAALAAMQEEEAA